jgi:hypothetical protein
MARFFMIRTSAGAEHRGPIVVRRCVWFEAGFFEIRNRARVTRALPLWFDIAFSYGKDFF